MCQCVTHPTSKVTLPEKNAAPRLMMTYSERYGGCSSSIITRLCPSTVNKSTQPCPILSLSPISTSSISNRPLATDILLSLPRCAERKELDVLSSTSVDYHSSKRIEQLHERMDEIQISSFLKFINYHLASKHDEHRVKDLTQDLSNGHILIDLIEIFSSTKLKREHGRTRFHSLSNVQSVLTYLKSHMPHIHISPHEIVAGNRKQILALLWIIMKIFDFPSFRLITNKHVFLEHTLLTCGQDRSTLLRWLNQLGKTRRTFVKDFHLSTWTEEDQLSTILKHLSPLSAHFSTAEYFEHLKQLDRTDLSKHERLAACLNFSTYAFETNPWVDLNDRTEKSLLRFFSELHLHIVERVKNQSSAEVHGKNLYIKELLETLLDTTQTDLEGDKDDYLIRCNELSSDQSLPISDAPVPAEQRCATPILDQRLANDDGLAVHDDNPSVLRSRKGKKGKRPVSTVLSTDSAINDLLIKSMECLRDPKLLVLKYLFLLLLCLCLSILFLFHLA